MTLPASDNFTAAANAALQTYSANWTISSGAFAVDAAADCVVPNNGSTDCLAWWNADAFAADQYSEGKLVGGGSANNSQIGVAVRVAAGNNCYGLYYQSAGQHIWLFKSVGGVWTELAYANGVGAWNNGDTIRLEVSGATLTPKHNGALIAALGTVNDSSLASGAAGICGYGLETACKLDDWQGGNLGVSGQTVALAQVASGAALYSPTVTAGAATVTLPLLAGTAALYGPTVSGVAVQTVTLPLIASAASAYAPAFLPGAAAVTLPLLSSGAAALAPDVLARACIGGVLQRDAANARWFYTGSAGTLMLAGFHVWPSLSDSWPTLPIQPFDFAAYLADVVGRGCNFVKLWSFETGRYWGDADQYFGPLPWARTGPGNAADGRAKFDLTQFDAVYFARLRERAIMAGNAGVYVCVQLFQGWHVSSKGLAYNPWPYHPMASGNNINSIDGDTNDDNAGLETRNTANAAVYALQQAYVAKVLETLADLDHVFYEIANEEDGSSFAWQVALMGYIRTQESGGKQHLVGLTTTWPGNNNAAILASTADWVSLADDLTPDAAPGTKASAGDTDHWVGLTSDRLWVWRAFCRGHNPWYMDEYAGETYGNDTRNSPTHQAIRANLGYALAYAARLDLRGAAPQNSLSSTGYALASDAQVLAYQDGSGSFTVNLASLPGVWVLEWLRPADGATQAGGSVNGGATRTLSPPWAGVDAVALLEKAADEITLALLAGMATVYAPTVTAGAVAVELALLAGMAQTFSPTVTAGTATVALPLLAGGSAAYAPVLTPGAVSVALGFAAAGAQVFAVTGAAGAVAAGLPLLAGTAQAFAPTLAAVAPDTVALPLLAGGAQVFALVVAAGAVGVELARIESGAAVYGPAVSGAADVALPLLGGGGETFGLEVTAGATTVAVGFVASSVQVFGLALGDGSAQGAALGFLPSAAQLFVAAVLAIPASRVFRVAAEERTFTAGYEDRTYAVQGE
jgi:hypothetical protein